MGALVQNTFKWRMLPLFLSALIVPYILNNLEFLFYAAPPTFPPIVVFVLSVALGGWLVYRAYRSGTEPATTSGKQPRKPAEHSLSLGMCIGLSLVGGVVGAAIGVLTRPTVLGERVPIQLLFAEVDELFAPLRDEYAIHVFISAIIGLVVVAILSFLASAMIRRA